MLTFIEENFSLLNFGVRCVVKRRYLERTQVQLHKLFFERMETEKKLFSFLQEKTLLFEKPYKNVLCGDLILLTSMRKNQGYY